MKILTEKNTVIDLDVKREPDLFCSVLSFAEFRTPDFFFRAITSYEQIECASASLVVGGTQSGIFNLVVPFPWCILVTDYETVDCMSIEGLLGKSMPAFTLNPIDGYRVEFLKIKLKMIYPTGSFIIPVLGNKDMLVVPLNFGRSRQDKNGNQVAIGPLCVILSPTKIELSKSISDIW